MKNRRSSALSITRGPQARADNCHGRLIWCSLGLRPLLFILRYPKGTPHQRRSNSGSLAMLAAIRSACPPCLPHSHPLCLLSNEASSGVRPDGLWSHCCRCIPVNITPQSATKAGLGEVHTQRRDPMWPGRLSALGAWGHAPATVPL